MGGYGSGRQGGRPTADASLRIDLEWMLRTGRAVAGDIVKGGLAWTCRGEPSGNISYTCDMIDPDASRLELRFTVTDKRTEKRTDYVQQVPLTFTEPNFGGKRWWMHCPSNASRVGKLYCPSGAHTFASRTAWRLGYQCQRDAVHDRSFERLFRLQKKLGGPQGWEAGISRPRGMWRRTYERHLKRYWELDAECAMDMAAMLNRLSR